MSVKANQALEQKPQFYNTEQLRELVDLILKEAKQQGASAAEAAVSAESGLSATVRLGEVDILEHNRDKGLGVTVYFGKRKASSSTTDFSPQAIHETVVAACDIARYTEEDECAGLADAQLMATHIPELDLYHSWPISTEQAIELARECEQAARDYDPRITNSEGAYVSSHDGLRVYANSHGFIGDYAASRHSIGCTVIATENDKMQRDYWYDVGRYPEALQDLRDIGVKAAQRTVARLSARKLKTQKVAVLFAPEVARGLLGHLVRALSGGALYRKASFLVDQLGEPLFPSCINIDERPHLKGALGSAGFDNEGVATQARHVVEEGILRGYVLDSYSARKLGMQTTGNSGGVHNLFIADSARTPAELLREMDRGILVTEVMGQGVNIVNGDYSRGAAGFWVENGEIQYPVEEFTLASNLRDMFKGLRAVGNDVDMRSSLCTGSWLIESMTVAGE